jgi:nicotinate-nucleotide adenylyltransferase
LGGSFNPAHAGHRLIAGQCRRALRLDQVWLLVSPGNPLKPRAGMAPFAARLASARAIADGRRIIATGIEAQLGTRFSRDTIAALQRRFPRARFVWLMGADLLDELPRWRGWREIARMLPLAVHPRPAYNIRARASRAASTLRHALKRPGMAPALAQAAPPAWVFLQLAQNPASASALRARQQRENGEKPSPAPPPPRAAPASARARPQPLPSPSPSPPPKAKPSEPQRRPSPSLPANRRRAVRLGRAAPTSISTG